MSEMQPVSVKIQNIVCTVRLGCSLDLHYIATFSDNIEYNPNRFPAVTMRIRTPRTTALIFKTGKLVVTGAKTEHDAKIATRRFARIIQKLGFKVKFKNFKIENVVGSSGLNAPICLNTLSSKLGYLANYEPELFPGLIYRPSNVVILIFLSGKMVLTGARTRQEIYKAYNNIYPILKQTCNL